MAGERVGRDLARQIDDENWDVLTVGTYTADTDQPVLELWLGQRHFRVFVADVIEVTE